MAKCPQCRHVFSVTKRKKVSAVKSTNTGSSARCPDFQDDNMVALDELLQKDEKKLDELLQEIRGEDSKVSKLLEEIRNDDAPVMKLLKMEQDTPSLECVVCTNRNCKKVK